VSVAEFPIPEQESGPDRTPPNDIAAEQSVLGAMLLSKDAIADVVETLREPDFYRPSHQTIFATILDLYGRGEPADAVTVAADLTKSGDITRVGGAPYLHTLVSMVPTAANAGYYGRIVREQAILRRLVDAGTRIVHMGYTGTGDVDDMVDRAQAEVYDVTDRRTSEDYLPLSDIMGDALNEIEAISNRGGEMVGVPTGFADLDALTNGLHGGQMVILAARPALGKSTLGLDICRSASIKHGLTSVIFSLEMSRNEIVMRLLSAEAQVPLHHMRSGNMSDADWSKLANKMGVVNDAPLFIDDSPNMTLMEIRAKCRRLKQRHNLRLVVVDYLQLMTSGKRVESRQQEVSEFSRSLKLLAKELDVPVIAISQLNRGPEQRTDKRPMLSDLRESGCLPGRTMIMRADTGASVPLADLLSSGETGIPVWALDDSLRYVPSTMTHAFSTGRKEVFRVTTASGRIVHATANHPLLTQQGWQPLAQIDTGTRIAISRHVPAPLQESDAWSEARLRQLAQEIGSNTRPTSGMPDDVFALPKQQLAHFLGALWAVNGSVDVHPDGRSGAIEFRAPGRAIADDIARLLLRFGLTARIRQLQGSSHHTVGVCGAADQKVFLRRIGFPGARAQRLLRVLDERHPQVQESTTPPGVWQELRHLMADASYADGGEHPERIGQVATLLDGADLDMVATNDVHWDVVVGIQSLGEEEVFDATVLHRHNFIADGVTVHNSLEQDADMVLLLHREDAYERESPRAGEADFIVAKHRNGPTSTVTVAFQGHYSRFVDMAQT
jgi:replicative DNA helicase